MYSLSPPCLATPLREEVNTQEIEDAMKIMRETRTEITILRNIKIVIFKERYKKKIHTYLSPKSIQKLVRHKITHQSYSRELCSDSEFISEEADVRKGTSQYPTHTLEQIHKPDSLKM